MPSSEYRTAVSQTLHYYKKLNCNHLVVDSAFAGPVIENDIIWACEKYEDFIETEQLEKIHVVRPYSVYTQYSILEFQRRLNGCLPILVYNTLNDILKNLSPN